MYDLFFNIFTHLLPNARAWRITSEKSLRRFFEGLSGVGGDIKLFFDNIFLDIFPYTTREVSAWELQFGLPDTGLTMDSRRSRLAATWRALGGQSPSYIQQTLRDAGFDVYVHEWWAPGTEPQVGIHSCVTPRNPLLYLRREYTGVVLLVECGEENAQCGESFAECGNSLEPRGYPLVNKIFQTVPDISVLCGEEMVQCGEENAQSGFYAQYKDILQAYTVPLDPNKWPYFLYIGGEIFGTLAKVQTSRKNELEDLCLKIRPAQQWLGMLIEYN